MFCYQRKRSINILRKTEETFVTSRLTVQFDHSMKRVTNKNQNTKIIFLLINIFFEL